MLSAETLRKAHLELTRLNRELHALHLEEERTKLKRSRLESDKTRVQSLVDICELAQILNMPAAGERFTIPGGKDGKEVTFRVEDCHGAKLIVAEKSSAPATVKIVDDLAIRPASPPQRRRKPDGLPTTPSMIVTVLREAGRPIRPSEIANSIRQRWWAELPAKVVYTNAYRMAKDGRLTAQEGRYFLNNGGSHE